MYPPATNTKGTEFLTPERRALERKPEEVSPLAVFLAVQTVNTMTGESVDFREWERRNKVE